MSETEVVILRDESDLKNAFPVVQVLWPDLEYESFVDAISSMTGKGYTLFGLRIGSTIVSIAGVQEIQLLARGKVLWLFDMATLEKHQGKGYGKRLLSFAQQYARENGYSRLLLHTGMERENTIRFYQSQLGDEFGVVFRAVTGPPDP